MRMKILLIPCCCFFMLILASASSSSSSFSLSNNDDLQVLELETEMQQLFRPEKWLHHFKDSVKDTIDCYSSLLPMVLPTNKKPDWVFRSKFLFFLRLSEALVIWCQRAPASFEDICQGFLCRWEGHYTRGLSWSSRKQMTKTCELQLFFF